MSTQCGWIRPTARSIALWRLSTSKNGSPASGIAAAITGNVADKHRTIHKWCHKDLFGERIPQGNLEYNIMSPLQAFLHMMPPAQLMLMMELTNKRLVSSEKQEMTRQDLLQ